MLLRLPLLSFFLLLPLAGCGGMSGLWSDSEAPQVSVTGEPLYCYGTLADPDCYAEPQPGWEGRLIGYYGPKP
jgi:hypothetical protein